ncbi:hypothetical protein LR48_Vigan02g012300 [Vigna angularis]|uniref:Uncharacterized protein n=1 Tax=Phaseolus angularis TaxID=3914 RepID=A0A0L9TTS7_PHAAN|nr:hypothetical protein LR48_Vigan02g012300 [Vigna angularis]
MNVGRPSKSSFYNWQSCQQAPMVETYKNNLFPGTPVRAAIGLIWERDELLDYQFS